MVSGVFKIDDIDPQGDSASSAHSCISSFFDTIPPERIGLNGEYDHHGLAKRVCEAFYAQVGLEDLRSLRVKQRGAVVVLSGKVQTYALLARLVHIALSVSGTVEVEANGVAVLEGCDRPSAHPGFFNHPRCSYSWVS